MSTSHYIQVAKTIQSQIGFIRLGALGAKNFTASANDFGGLSFKASLFGRRQCLVEVALNGLDLYDVKVLSPKSRKEIFSARDLYAEDLGPALEEAVEKHFAG